jgi:hypothetical protein
VTQLSEGVRNATPQPQAATLAGGLLLVLGVSGMVVMRVCNRWRRCIASQGKVTPAGAFATTGLGVGSSAQS